MRIVLVLIFTFYLSFSYGQLLTGNTVDERNEPLPFVTIHIMGTTSNSNGAFQLKLKSGKQVVVVQFVGYQKQQREIEVGSTDIKIDFQLLPEVFKLRGRNNSR